MLLEGDKGAGEWDEALVKRPVGPSRTGQPQLLQHFVGFVKQATIEAIEVAQVMRVRVTSLAAFNQRGDSAALPAHGRRLRPQARSVKPPRNHGPRNPSLRGP